MAATLTMHYWDELSSAPTLSLAQVAGASDTVLNLSAAGTAAAGSFIQLEAEVIQVQAVEHSGMQYQVTRGLHNSTAAAHAAQTLVYPLQSQTVITAFPPHFFGSPYSGSWSYSVPQPDVRIASAELFVTNRLGNSPAGSICMTSTE
jgi:hypothetical protein